MASRLIATLALGLFVAACIAPAAAPSGEPLTRSASPAASPGPSPSAEAGAEPGGMPTPSRAPSEQPHGVVPIPINTYAQVVTNDLRVRSKPGVSDDSRRLTPLLQNGVWVVVLDGPVEASGFDWYHVLPVYTSDTSDQILYPSGWVAAADKGGERWLKALPLECPAAPANLMELADLLSGISVNYDALTCLSGREISFKARVGQPEARCGVAMPWGVDPTWFDPCLADETYLVPVADMDSGPELHPAWAPDVDTSIAGPPNAHLDDMPIVEVAGMFDHPAARTCRNRIEYDDPDFPEPDPAVTILTCRLTFVVTSMQKVED